MAEAEHPFIARLVEIVNATIHGDASSYDEPEILTAIGAVWISRRQKADEPATAQLLDQALELLAVEIEAREVLADNPFRDLGEPDGG